jgi:hypothetical protein
MRKPLPKLAMNSFSGLSSVFAKVQYLSRSPVRARKTTGLAWARLSPYVDLDIIKSPTQAIPFLGFAKGLFGARRII